MKYRHLLSPLPVGNVTLKNRISSPTGLSLLSRREKSN